MTAHTEQDDVLRDGAGYCDFSSRTQIEILGADRAKVLHGLCTNDINRLNSGEGCEAFLTNIQGRTIGFVYVFCLDKSLVLETVPGHSDHLIASIDRYVIREDVALSDRSAEWGELLLSGEQSASLLGSLADFELPSESLGTCQGLVAGIETEVRRVSYCAPTAFFLRCQANEAQQLAEALESADAAACSPEAVDIGRIEMGTPLFGQDITDENLPQEVNRDSQAISFTKGCYLGQETVARIDALGHVNRKLVQLRFAGEQVPAPGSPIELDGKRLATITSSCISERLGRPLALAYVRRGQERPGNVLASEYGDATVVQLFTG
ncbi:MAG: folate-binding protein [Planctomycetaceae bacterium]|nr:folate-binding protein [Planctomycetaceae bacterium]